MSILLLTFIQQQLQCYFHRSLGILSAEAGCARPPDILSLQNQESPSQEGTAAWGQALTSPWAQLVHFRSLHTAPRSGPSVPHSPFHLTV